MSSEARLGPASAAAPEPERRRTRMQMLVSAAADARLRADVADGTRPRPEYLLLESRYGVALRDWSGSAVRRRRSLQALRFSSRAAAELDDVSCVLSDGEHVGVPLAIAMGLRHRATPHVMIAHHLTTPQKVLAVKASAVARRIDVALVHSQSQADLVAERLGGRLRVAVVHYGIDTDFWRPGAPVGQSGVLAVGREHRDYATLALASRGAPFPVVIADGSPHSPAAKRRLPAEWPPNVTRRWMPLLELRRAYAAAAVVVVPVVETGFPAGITTLLEAMAMGKAVVVTETAGLKGFVRPGRTGLVVPPHDRDALRDAIDHLLSRPDVRARLGVAAREAVLGSWTLDHYTRDLHRHMLAAAASR